MIRSLQRKYPRHGSAVAVRIANRANKVPAMSRYAAFLRAINLGPRRRLSGADLRARFEGLGFTDVETFRTSGNVVFEVGAAKGDFFIIYKPDPFDASRGIWKVTV